MKYGFMRSEDELFPPIIHVENTNVCNLRCIHCPHHDILKVIPNYKPQSIRMDLWKRVVDEVAQYPCALRLTPDGEPMLPHDFVAQAEYALDKGVHIFTLNANGTYLEGGKAEVLLRPGKTKIALEVSLDALHADSYAKIRVGGDYARVVRNVMNFIRERDRRGLDNVRILVSVVQQPELPEGELEQFNRFWSPLVDKVIIRNYVDTKGLTPKKMVDQRVVEKRWPCPVIFTRLVVTYDGTVRFCPDDWQKTTRLPSLEEAGSLAAIWQSETYRKLRQSHLEGTFLHPTCAACTDWKVIRWGIDYNAALKQLFDESTKKDDAAANLKYLWNGQRDGKADVEAEVEKKT